MDCPVCNEVKLVMSDRQGIEIDYCPQCRGVWLDRGELDKLIERSSTETPQHQPSQERAARPPQYDSQQYDNRRDSGHHGYKKKKGLLGELFDF